MINGLLWGLGAALICLAAILTLYTRAAQPSDVVYASRYDDAPGLNELVPFSFGAQAPAVIPVALPVMPMVNDGPVDHDADRVASMLPQANEIAAADPDTLDATKTANEVAPHAPWWHAIFQFRKPAVAGNAEAVAPAESDPPATTDIAEETTSHTPSWSAIHRVQATSEDARISDDAAEPTVSALADAPAPVSATESVDYTDLVFTPEDGVSHPDPGAVAPALSGDDAGDVFVIPETPRSATAQEVAQALHAAGIWSILFGWLRRRPTASTRHSSALHITNDEPHSDSLVETDDQDLAASAAPAAYVEPPEIQSEAPPANVVPFPSRAAHTAEQDGQPEVDPFGFTAGQRNAMVERAERMRREALEQAENAARIADAALQVATAAAAHAASTERTVSWVNELLDTREPVSLDQRRRLLDTYALIRSTKARTLLERAAEEDPELGDHARALLARRGDRA